MKYLCLLAVLPCLASLRFAESGKALTRDSDSRRFPDDFVFGAATASYQIEGAWDEDGKSESIWDRLTHDGCQVDECHTGDVATDSYHNYKRDVEMMRELGLDYYRFSLSWPRILPSGFANEVNQAGVTYYNNLINEMIKYNIQPMVTLYHWDLPQRLQDLGGWANPLIVDWFGDYARIAYELFGDRVKTFITINEPICVCYLGYGEGTLAPGLTMDGVANYICSKNLLVAHARAWHIYDDEFRGKQGGINGIALYKQWYEPASDSEDDVQAVDDMTQFEWEYSHPIFSESGDWHPTLKDKIAERSVEQGYSRSRLPEFTPEEIDYVKGASDFMGINMYTAYYAYRNDSLEGTFNVPSYYHDAYVGTFQDPEWPGGASSWLKEAGWGLHKLLLKVKEDFNNPIVYITENGFSSRGGLEDDDRIQYYRNYLTAVLDALDDGCDVRGYTAWSLMDNFEWMRGYTERFGLYEVDFEDPARARTPRQAAFMYKEIIRSRTIDYEYRPESMTMSIEEGH